MALPYENATSGERAVNDMQKVTDQKGNPLRVGDPVSFSLVRHKGNGFVFSAKEARIVSFNETENDGVYVVVKYRNGRNKILPASKVRRSDLEQNEMTDAFKKAIGGK